MSALAKTLAVVDVVNLFVCIPYGTENDKLHGKVENIEYFSFPKTKNTTRYDFRIQKRFEEILDNIQPDIIHIWGTEYPHTLAVINACEKLKYLEKAVISIQGLCHICSLHYRANLPDKIVQAKSLRDWIRCDNVKNQKKKFEQRGRFEIEAIKKARHIIGRTTWDKVCVFRINPHSEYHFCNEILREQFYMSRWRPEKCKRHTLFVSQGSYPIKGFHHVLEAMPIIRTKYPDVHLVIAGMDIYNLNWLRRSAYHNYIRKLIRVYDLQNSVTFVGQQDEKQMCEQYLEANVYVLSSSIENSSNSLGEAMLLGVPCVASYVGGIPDMLKNNFEGFLYQHDAPYMLAHYICELFSNPKLAMQFSKRSQKRAAKTHDVSLNMTRMLEIYEDIYLDSHKEGDSHHDSQ